jgi:hypothetical protein
MKRCVAWGLSLAAGLWWAAAAGAGPPQPINEIRALAAALADQLVEAFPVLEGTVVDLDGTVVEAAFLGEAQLWTANVDFYRSSPTGGGTSTLHKVGVGRVLSAEPGRARLEVVSAESKIGLGDRVRSSVGLVGIGILPVADRGARRGLIELLAVRVAYELEARGRFQVEMLDTDSDAASSTAPDSVVRAYLWRGLRYTLELTFVEEGSRATLVGRLSSLKDRRPVDVVSASVALGESWPALLASLAGGASMQTHAVVHRQAVVEYRPVALCVLELQDRVGVLALSRDAAHLLMSQAGDLREERTFSIPQQVMLPRGARDFSGVIVPEKEGRLRFGHTLLQRSLSLELSTSKMELGGPELWLGEHTAPLLASYRPGANWLGPLQIGETPLASADPPLRFAGWLANGEILVQTEGYRLVLLDPVGGGRQEISPPLGAGVSVLPLASPLVAATAPTVAGDPGAASDQVTIFELEDGRLKPIWRSEPTSGALIQTSLALLHGQLHLAVAETRPDGCLLHLYSNLPIPTP